MAARSLSKEYRMMLDAYERNQGRQFNLEQMAQPLYQSLNLQNINDLLNGTAAQDYTSYEWQAPIYSRTGAAQKGGFSGGLVPGLPSGIAGVPGTGTLNRPEDYFADALGLGSSMGAIPGIPGSGLAGKLFGLGDDEDKKQLLKKGYWKPRQIKRDAQRGLLQIFEEDVIPSQLRQATQQRTADIADVKNLSPAMREALRIADPDSAKLLDGLNEQADSELGMGTDLDPSLSRLVSQSIRKRQSGTLLSNGNAGAYDEALGMSEFGQNVRNQRRSFAGGVINQNQQFYGSPLQSILGRSNGSAALPFAQQASQLAGQAGAKGTNFESPYASDLFGSNFNAAINAAINKKNNQTALIGAGIGAVGSIAGGAMAMT